jgi:NADH:ubiquinone oxidoreductase subunit 3 (subunit A)
LWTTATAPRYLAGLIVSVASWGLLVVLMLVYWFIGSHENHRRDQVKSDSTIPEYEPGADVTDKQDLTFRYST